MAKSKKTPEMVAEMIRLLSKGATDKCAYEAVGISKETFYKWIKEDADFADTIKKTIGEAYGKVTSKLADLINDGNLGAIIFWLTNRRKDDWQNTQHIKQENSGGSLNKEVKEWRLTIDERSNKEKKELITAVRKLANRRK